MRNLCSDDIEKVLSHSPRSIGEGLPGTVPLLDLCFYIPLLVTIAMLLKKTCSEFIYNRRYSEMFCSKLYWQTWIMFNG
jgi:hypothetical protein